MFFFQTLMFNFQRVKHSDKRRELHVIFAMQKISCMLFFESQGAYVLEDFKINCCAWHFFMLEKWKQSGRRSNVRDILFLAVLKHSSSLSKSPKCCSLWSQRLWSPHLSLTTFNYLIHKPTLGFSTTDL